MMSPKSAASCSRRRGAHATLQSHYVHTPTRIIYLARLKYSVCRHARRNVREEGKSGRSTNRQRVGERRLFMRKPLITAPRAGREDIEASPARRTRVTLTFV